MHGVVTLACLHLCYVSNMFVAYVKYGLVCRWSYLHFADFFCFLARQRFSSSIKMKTQVLGWGVNYEILYK